MAIEYSIAIHSSKSPAETLTRLIGQRSFEFRGDPRPEACGEGIVCTALPQSTVGQDLIHETFGIQTSVAIICRIDKFDLLSVGMNQLVDLCVGLVRSETSDFVFLGNCEAGLLLRKDGHLQADCRDEYWKAKWNSKFLPAGIEFVAAALPTI